MADPDRPSPKPYSTRPARPLPASEAVSKYMRGNKSRDTGPELRFRKALREAGIKGYRLHWKQVPGSPDIAFPGRKVAVFLHGCFWHRCPHCQLGMPKHNAEYWEEKFKRNVERDRDKQVSLAGAGWQVLVVWECEMKEDMALQVRRVGEMLCPKLG